jgi:signal transduction histidine kinase
VRDDLQQQLDAAKRRLDEVTAELAAHEGLLKFAMTDMQKMYDDLLTTHSKLLQADKLATVGLLTAGIVHEINNPLMAAHGFVSLWVETASTPEDKEMARDALECLERIQSIVRDIRTFSRADKNNKAPESLEKIIDSAATIAWHAVKAKADIVRDYDAALAPVICNPQQIGQVFLNLIVNASQAIEARGTITLRTRSEGGFAVGEVRDDGSGMAPETLAKLFEPFFTTKGPEKGTGLGLSISRDIVKNHGGDVEVESAPGKGTVFRVKIPL